MDKIKFGGVFDVTCLNSTRQVKWKSLAHNMVVDAGIQHIEDIIFTGAGGQITVWYAGVANESPAFASTDTSSSHGGWTMFTAYSEAAHQAWVETRSGNALTNSASKAAFSINASGTAGGMYLISYATLTSTTGILLCGASFTAGNQSVENGDTLNVQYDFTGADA